MSPTKIETEDERPKRPKGALWRPGMTEDDLEELQIAIDLADPATESETVAVVVSGESGTVEEIVRLGPRTGIPARSRTGWESARFAIDVWASWVIAGNRGASLPNMPAILEKSETFTRVYRHRETGEIVFSFMPLDVKRQNLQFLHWQEIRWETSTNRLDHPVRLIGLAVETALAQEEREGTPGLRRLVLEIAPRSGVYEAEGLDRSIRKNGRDMPLPDAYRRSVERAYRIAQRVVIDAGIMVEGRNLR